MSRAKQAIHSVGGGGSQGAEPHKIMCADAFLTGFCSLDTGHQKAAPKWKKTGDRDRYLNVAMRIGIKEYKFDEWGDTSDCRRLKPDCNSRYVQCWANVVGSEGRIRVYLVCDVLKLGKICSNWREFLDEHTGCCDVSSPTMYRWVWDICARIYTKSTTLRRIT